MKNIFGFKNTIIFILVLVIFGLVAYYQKDKFLKDEVAILGIENNIADLNKDIEFYKYLGIYASLLPDDKFKIVDDRINKVSEEIDREDSKIQNIMILTTISEIMNESGSKDVIFELKDTISELLKDSKMDKDTLFTKNTECAKLSSNIKNDLTKKYKDTSFTKEKEELNFIFYSPTLNTCIYTTNYDYNYSSYLNGKSEYYSKNSHRIYDISSDKQLGDYPSFYYEYPYLTKEQADMSVKNGNKDYKKFVLKNSGYNAKLLKDINY